MLKELKDLEWSIIWKVFFSTLFMLLIFALLMTACDAGHRVYTVWSSSKIGEAELARAESNRQIKTLEAKAALESAKYLADAEMVRAEGVAKANEIIGAGLKDNEQYLRYLWIQSLSENKGATVYVPTECGLPLLECNRKVK